VGTRRDRGPLGAIAAAAALALSAGCTLFPETFTVKCGKDNAASHDFGTTDLATLGRVVAFVAEEGHASMEQTAPISFDGSVGTVGCPTPDAVVTFVLEP
jgi:hypothetical protein